MLKCKNKEKIGGKHMKKKLIVILCAASLVTSVMPVTAADTESNIYTAGTVKTETIQDETEVLKDEVGISEDGMEFPKDETTGVKSEVPDSETLETETPTAETKPEIETEKNDEVTGQDTANDVDTGENAADKQSAVVLPSQPITGLTAKGAGKNIKLAWNGSAGAEGYIIYRQIGNGKFQYLYMVSKTNFVDTKASADEYNFYRVYPYVTDTSGNRIVGKSTAYVFAKPSLDAATNLTAKGTGNKQVTVSWSKVADAEGYIIYRQIGNEKMSYRYMVSGTSFIDTTASNGEYNFYRIYPYFTSSSGKLSLGPSTSYVFAKAQIPAVTGLKAVSQKGGVKVSWNSVSRVDGYLIYRKVGTGVYKYRYMTSGTQFIDTTASTEEFNFYWVFPYCNENNKMIVGGTAAYVYGKSIFQGKTSYAEGTYLVGTDIPAGNYVVSGELCYFKVCDSFPSDNNFDNIIVNDIFTGNRYITLHNGEYYQFERGVTVPLAVAPKYTANNGVYRAGMYLVGRDIDPGRYYISVDRDATYGYYEVKSGAYNAVPGKDLEGIIDNDLFTSTRYVNVEKGQYLILERANAVRK